MGRIKKDDRCLIKGPRTEKNGLQTPNKRVSEQEMVCGKCELFDFKKIENSMSTEGKTDTGHPRSDRTADNLSMIMIQDMMQSR